MAKDDCQFKITHSNGAFECLCCGRRWPAGTKLGDIKKEIRIAYPSRGDGPPGWRAGDLALCGAAHSSGMTCDQYKGHGGKHLHAYRPGEQPQMFEAFTWEPR